MKTFSKLLPTLLAVVAILIALSNAQVVRSRPPLGVTNFDSIHLRDTNGTATPNFLADQRGSGVIAEFRDGATPVARIPNGGGLTVLSGGLTVDAGGLSVTAGALTASGGLRLTAQSETVTTTWVITPAASYILLSSTAEVTSSTTTGIVTTTATTGDVVILQNDNASDVINVDGTGGTIDCKADVALGSGDTLSLIYNGNDEVWNCLANYDNS